MVNVSPWRHRIICNILRPQHTRRRFQHQRALHLVQRSKTQQLSRNPYYFLSDIPLTSSTKHVSTAWVVNIATPTTSYPTSRSTRTWLLHAWVVNLATVSMASSSDMFLFIYILPGLHLSVCSFPFPFPFLSFLSFLSFPFFPCFCFLSALHSLAGASAEAWGNGELFLPVPARSQEGGA